MLKNKISKRQQKEPKWVNLAAVEELGIPSAGQAPDFSELNFFQFSYLLYADRVYLKLM